MERWLRREATVIEAVKTVLLLWLVGVVYFFFASTVLILFDIKVGYRSQEEGILILSLQFPFFVIFWAFVEEMWFRFPLLIAAKWEFRDIMLFAVGLSVIFGYAHGSIYNLPIQGVQGFLFSIVFLKCGGLQRRPIKAIICSTSVHALYNYFVAFMALLNGATNF